MSVHRYHPDPARGETFQRLLYDDCEECALKAETLTGLDLPHLRALLQVVVDDIWPYVPNATEQAAESRFWHALLVMERLTGRDWRELLGVDDRSRVAEQHGAPLSSRWVRAPSGPPPPESSGPTDPTGDTAAYGEGATAPRGTIEAGSSQPLAGEKGRVVTSPAGGSGRGRGRRKLTPREVREIRASWASGLVSQSALARDYGVRQSTVHYIVWGQTWRWVR